LQKLVGKRRGARQQCEETRPASEVTATGLTTATLEDNRKETKDKGEMLQCEEIYDTHNTRDAKDNDIDNDGDQQKDHDGENKTVRMSAARRFLLRLGVVPHHCWVCSSLAPGFRTTLQELDIIEEQKREKMKVKASGDDWSKGEEKEDVEEEGEERWGASSSLTEDCKRTSSITNRLKATLRRIRGKKEREAKKQREIKHPADRDPEEDIPFETIRQLHDEEMEAARKRGARALKCFKRRAAQCIAEDIVSKNRSGVYAPLYFGDLSDSQTQAGSKHSASRRERGRDRSDNARDNQKNTECQKSRRYSRTRKESTESRRNSQASIGGDICYSGGAAVGSDRSINIDEGERQVAGLSGVVSAKNTKKNTKKHGTNHGHDDGQQQSCSIQRDTKKNISDHNEDDIVRLNWNQNANVGEKGPGSAGNERQKRASRVREHKGVCTDRLKNSCSCLITTFLCFFLCVCPK
jgi:hypothetical protein